MIGVVVAGEQVIDGTAIAKQLVHGATFVQKIGHDAVGLAVIGLVVAGEQVIDGTAIAKQLVHGATFAKKIVHQPVGLTAVGHVVAGEQGIDRPAVAQEVVDRPVFLQKPGLVVIRTADVDIDQAIVEEIIGGAAVAEDFVKRPALGQQPVDHALGGRVVCLFVAGEQVIDRPAVAEQLIDQTALRQKVVDQTIGFAAICHVVAGEDAVEHAAIAREFIEDAALAGEIVAKTVRLAAIRPIVVAQQRVDRATVAGKVVDKAVFVEERDHRVVLLRLGWVGQVDAARIHRCEGNEIAIADCLDAVHQIVRIDGDVERVAVEIDLDRDLRAGLSGQVVLIRREQRVGIAGAGCRSEGQVAIEEHKLAADGIRVHPEGEFGAERQRAFDHRNVAVGGLLGWLLREVFDSS